LSAWFELQKRLDDYQFKFSLSYQIVGNSHGKWTFFAMYKASPIIKITDCDNMFFAIYFGVQALKNKYGGNFDINIDAESVEETGDNLCL